MHLPLTRTEDDIRGLTLDPVLPFSVFRQPPDTVPDFHALLGLAADDVVLPTYSGTTALYQGLKMAGIGPGDRVLVPSYNCGHEVEAVLRTGASIECFRIDLGLKADLDDLCRLLKQPAKAVVVTHYFGFPQAMAEISQLCREAGALLLEDAVPALFSKDDSGVLGSLGDIAAFSFRKTLPIPVGGAVAFRKGVAPKIAEPLSLPPALTRARRTSLLAYKAMSRWTPGASGHSRRVVAAGLLGAHKACVSLQYASALAGNPQHDLDSEAYDFPSAALHWGMDLFSQRVLASFNPEQIASRRQRFFNLLHAGLEHAGESGSLLPAACAGTVPLQYVLMAQERETLLPKLQRGGIPALGWWSEFHPAVEWDRFPEAVRLKQSLIALPVHQGLEDCHIAAMLRRLQRLLPDRLSTPEAKRVSPDYSQPGG